VGVGLGENFPRAGVKKFLAGKSKSTFLALLVCQPAGRVFDLPRQAEFNRFRWLLWSSTPGLMFMSFERVGVHNVVKGQQLPLYSHIFPACTSPTSLSTSAAMASRTSRAPATEWTLGSAMVHSRACPSLAP
jgi:hypothetical protein